MVLQHIYPALPSPRYDNTQVALKKKKEVKGEVKREEKRKIYTRNIN